MKKNQLTFCSELVFFPCFCALLQTVLTDESGIERWIDRQIDIWVTLSMQHIPSKIETPCVWRVDHHDSPRRPDDLVVQDTNLMHLPSTVFTFNKPEEGEKNEDQPLEAFHWAAQHEKRHEERLHSDVVKLDREKNNRCRTRNIKPLLLQTRQFYF